MHRIPNVAFLSIVSRTDTVICMSHESKHINLSLEEALKVGFTYKIHEKNG